MKRGRNDFSPDNGAVMRRVRQWRKCANCIDSRSLRRCINSPRFLCRLSGAAQFVLAFVSHIPEPERISGAWRPGPRMRS